METSCQIMSYLFHWIHDIIIMLGVFVLCHSYTQHVFLQMISKFKVSFSGM
jgi:hypothetical protein